MGRQNSGNFENGRFTDTIHYTSKAEIYGEGYTFNPYYNFVPYTNQMQKYDGLNYSNGYPGDVMRFIVEYDDSANTEPLFISSFFMYRSVIDMEIIGPDTVYAGQQTRYNLQHGIIHHWGQPEPEEEPSAASFSWSAWSTATGSSSNITWISERYADSVDIAFNDPGRYEIQGRKYYSSFYNDMSSDNYVYRYITVLEMPDTAQFDPCDTTVYTLPYNADFTQCWQATDGVFIVNANMVIMNSDHCTITSPLVHCDSNTYLSYTDYVTCGSLTRKLYDTNGNYIKDVYQGVPFNVPESDYYVTIEISTTCSDFYPIDIYNFQMYNYIAPEMVISPTPDTMYVGDTLSARLLAVDSTTDIRHIRDRWVFNRNGTFVADISCWGDLSVLYIFAYSGTYIIDVMNTDSVVIATRTIVVLDAPEPETPSCVIDQFPYYEDFSGDIDCWTGPQYYYYVSQLASGKKGLYVREGGYACSPQLNLGGRYHLMTFHAQNSEMANNSLKLRYGSDSDSSYFIFILKGTSNEYQLLLPPTTTFFKFIPRTDNTSSYTSFGNAFIDDITITPLGIAADSSVTIVDTVHRDTVVYNITYQDSVEYNITVQDSVAWNIMQSDSIIYIYDTTCVTHDTIVVDNYIHDTTIVTNTVIDTVTLVQVDTVVNTIFDTTQVTDTLWMTDTLIVSVYVTDTVYIHDTIYVGIDGDASMTAVKMYQRGGQIVVESTSGEPLPKVRVFDAVGRVLENGPIATGIDYIYRFDVPSSGVYLVRIGSHSSRKVVVVR